MAQTRPALFQPVKVGGSSLQHRVVLCPLTRFRASKTHVPILPIVKEYYTQRGSRPGTLLISEAAFIAEKAGGYPNAPGIWSDEQIDAWKEVVSSVHAQGSFIYLQLWALGRAASQSVLKSENESYDVVSSSDIPLADPEKDKPRPLTIEEIHEYAELYAQASVNAVLKAGFDGVEVHAANGYLIDQFIQDTCNNRTDLYGGSIENRCRFAMEVVEKVVKAVGENRTGIRFGPWSEFQDMCMKDPKPTFTYLVQQLKQLYPTLAYIHLIEPKVKASQYTEEASHSDASNDFLREIWGERPFISAGKYDRESAIAVAEKSARDGRSELVAFGKYYISNPDLPTRLEEDIPLTPYNRSVFFLMGDTTPEGYTDYSFASDETRDIQL
ncbi:hypothetical protein V5O48_010853 [Marasmius crinis-equi]|uniref:NADH:flavin oxidoreductase/NADH oxidase N-terminal domain-containing protein n=1 Tax=Marasmius crinis-equi TaxID=585013 RepID=A0ABR3F783_9AGAR